METLRSEYIVTSEFYHVYNRGVDKRNIVMDKFDCERFLESLQAFNAVEPTQGFFNQKYKNEHPDGTQRRHKKGSRGPCERLVNIIAFCLNPNHYHFILEQLVDGGISELLKRVGGYTKYFNERHKRSGALFQGKYKVKHIDSNDYLLHTSAYVNLNNRVHKIGDPLARLVRSSYDQYLGKKLGFCKTDIILDQFSSAQGYEKFCEESLELMLQRKEEDQELKELCIE